MQYRIEGFSVLNHAQFYGADSVDGVINDTQHFGEVVSAAAPRLIQAAAKFTFYY